MDQRTLESYRKQFHDQGFFVVPELLDQAGIQRFRGVSDALVERSRSVTKSDDVFDLEQDHTRERPRLRRIKAKRCRSGTSAPPCGNLSAI